MNTEFSSLPKYLPCLLLGMALSTHLAQGQPSGTNCIPAPPNLVSWWRAEGDASDAFGANYGTFEGDTSFDAGTTGSAFTFDGSRDAVKLGAPADLQLQDFTIEAWIKRASSEFTSFDHQPYANLFAWGAGGYTFGVRSDGRLYLGRVEVSELNGTNVVTDTEWHHVAVTKSGSVVIFYGDGAAYLAPSYNPGFTFSTTLAIGAQGDNLNASFYGSIDELAVYNRPLSALEIRAIYNAGGLGKCTSPSPPVIVAGPESQVVHVADDVTFSVTVFGTTPLMFQWNFNGTNIAGATNSTLVLTNVQTVQAGAYSVEVTNDLGSVTSSDAVLAVNPTFCVNPPANTVSWWRAESNALDSVGNNNGNILATYGMGRSGAAFQFEGNNNAVLLGNPASLQRQDFTIEAWIKRSSPTAVTLSPVGTAAFISYGSGGYGFGLDASSRLFLSRIQFSNVTTTNTITDTNWHHVAVTKLGSAVIFYVDGLGFPASAYNPGFTFTTPVTIGARGDDLSGSFFGLVDEMGFYSRALTPVEVQALYNAGASGKCLGALPPYGPVPPYFFSQPASQTNTVWSSPTFSVLAGGSAPLSYQWRLNGTNLPGATNSSMTLTNLQLNQAGNYSVVVSNSADSLTSSNAVLSVVFPTPEVRAPSTNIVAGQTFALPILLVANGNERTLNFSLSFTAARLNYGGISLGSGAAGALLAVDTTQLGSGRLGVTTTMPAQTTFAPGTQEVARVFFNSSWLLGGSSVNTTVNFGDQPVARQMTNAAGTSLSANYLNATVTLLPSAFEGDVSPRTNGNQNIAAGDWDQMGRFVARLDTPAAGGEFQRADCAPRDTSGDGQLKVTDWVQAGRYASGFDLLRAMGGPASEVASTNSPSPGARELRISNTSAVQGVAVAIPINLAAQGSENALAFSLAFDSAKFTYVSASLGKDAVSAALFVNTSQAATGNIGIVLALPTGNNFASGTREIARLTLKPTALAVGNSSVSFNDQPVPRSNSNPNADELGASYVAGSVNVNPLPKLNIATAGTNVAVSWPVWAADFNLQSRTNALSGNWSNVATVLQTNGGDVTTVQPVGGDTRFFRLFHP